MSPTLPNPIYKADDSSIALTTRHQVRIPVSTTRVIMPVKHPYFFGSLDEFGVSFPDRRGKQDGDGAAPGSAVVLVVDDDPEIRLIVGEVLTFEGYKVVEAADGAEALRVLQLTHPDLVLLDMRMPVMDGWSFAEQLQQRGIRLPILVMTAAMDSRRWAADIQAQGYLSKPFDIIDLLEAVSRLTAH